MLDRLEKNTKENQGGYVFILLVGLSVSVNKIIQKAVNENKE